MFGDPASSEAFFLLIARTSEKENKKTPLSFTHTRVMGNIYLGPPLAQGGTETGSSVCYLDQPNLCSMVQSRVGIWQHFSYFLFYRRKKKKNIHSNCFVRSLIWTAYVSSSPLDIIYIWAYRSECLTSELCYHGLDKLGAKRFGTVKSECILGSYRAMILGTWRSICKVLLAFRNPQLE